MRKLRYFTPWRIITSKVLHGNSVPIQFLGLPAMRVTSCSFLCVEQQTLPTCTHPILITDVIVVVLTICECPTWMLKIYENFILKLKFWTLWIKLKFPCDKEIDLCQVWHRRDFEIRVHVSWLYVLTFLLKFWCFPECCSRCNELASQCEQLSAALRQAQEKHAERDREADDRDQQIKQLIQLLRSKVCAQSEFVKGWYLHEEQ